MHGDLQGLSDLDYRSFNLLRGMLTADGAHDLHVSASTPEDLGGGPWRNYERPRKRSRRASVIAKSNDATGRVVDGEADGEMNWPKVRLALA